MVGTEVLGQGHSINEEEFLSPSDGSHSFFYLHPRGPVKSLHVDLFQNFAGDCSF